jgi:hypothetical protein
MPPKKKPLGLDEGAIGWIKNYVRRNHWRVSRWIDRRDLVQDGCALFLQCRKKRPDITEQALLMRYFKTAFANYVNDCSNRRTREAIVNEEMPETVPDEPEHELATLYVTLCESPAAVRRLLLLLADDRQRKLLEPYRRDERGVRETTNQWLCRIVQADPEEIDLRGLLTAILSNGGNE